MSFWFHSSRSNFNSQKYVLKDVQQVLSLKTVRGLLELGKSADRAQAYC